MAAGAGSLGYRNRWRRGLQGSGSPVCTTSPAVSMAKAFMVVTFNTSHNVLEKNIRGWQILLKKVRCIDEPKFLERRVRQATT